MVNFLIENCEGFLCLFILILIYLLFKMFVDAAYDVIPEEYKYIIIEKEKEENEN